VRTISCDIRNISLNMICFTLLGSQYTHGYDRVRLVRVIVDERIGSIVFASFERGSRVSTDDDDDDVYYGPPVTCVHNVFKIDVITTAAAVHLPLNILYVGNE